MRQVSLLFHSTCEVSTVQVGKEDSVSWPTWVSGKLLWGLCGRHTALTRWNHHRLWVKRSTMVNNGFDAEWLTLQRSRHHREALCALSSTETLLQGIMLPSQRLIRSWET